MKKIYSIPAITVVEITLNQQMLAGSDPNVEIDMEGSVEAANVDSRRRSSLWDDEEEDF